MSEWNGMAVLPPTPHLLTKEMESDVSSSWGCGVWHENWWFQLQWDHASRDSLITVKKLLPIVLACAVWGASWASRWVLVHCDNQAMVASLRSRTC